MLRTSIIQNMPRKPRRSRLAKSLRSHNAAVFVSDKKPQEELDDPWCSDDDLVLVGSLLDDDDNDPDTWMTQLKMPWVTLLNLGMLLS